MAATDKRMPARNTEIPKAAARPGKVSAGVARRIRQSETGQDFGKHRRGQEVTPARPQRRVVFLPTWRYNYHMQELQDIINQLNGTLPAFAAVAIAKEMQVRLGVWRQIEAELQQGISDAEAETLPDMFAGATSPEVLRGLLMFSAHFGGQRIYVPQQMTREHNFAVIAGYETACYLVERFGALPIFVPHLCEIYRIARNRMILRDHAAGMPCSELAKRYGVSYPRIFALIVSKDTGRRRRLSDDAGGLCQPGLFDDEEFIP